MLGQHIARTVIQVGIEDDGQAQAFCLFAEVRHRRLKTRGTERGAGVAELQINGIKTLSLDISQTAATDRGVERLGFRHGIKNRLLHNSTPSTVELKLNTPRSHCRPASQIR